MDTSETYVLMCREAEKILDVAPICMTDTGRFRIICQDDDVWYRQGAVFNNEGFCTNDAELVWLPRQDQLQDMLPFPVGKFNDNFWTALDELRNWGFETKFVGYIPTSMEQLWLAFVMREKYNKEWNGKDWIEA